jgi:hypothetical protein
MQTCNTGRCLGGIVAEHVHVGRWIHRAYKYWMISWATCGDKGVFILACLAKSVKKTKDIQRSDENNPPLLVLDSNLWTAQYPTLSLDNSRPCVPGGALAQQVEVFQL